MPKTRQLGAILQNMSGLNLSRLTAKLIHPDRQLTEVDKTLADHVMHEITGKPIHKA